MQLPVINRCEVDVCFYNRDNDCHAPAINVGSQHPECDTFVRNEQGHISRPETGQVGACHVSRCRWNADLTCHADGITVAYHLEHADCATFEERA